MWTAAGVTAGIDLALYAGHAIEHAEEAVAGSGEEDPVVVERWRKALEGMSARKALQRASDKQNGAAKDAARLEEERRGND